MTAGPSLVVYPRRMRPVNVLLACCGVALIMACGSTSSPPVDDADAAVVETPISLNLSDATVNDVLQAIAAAAKKPLVVDAEAQQVVQCARISVLTGGPASPQVVVRLVGEALEPSGLLLVESESGGLIVRRQPGSALPPSCSSLKPPVTPPVDDFPLGPSSQLDPAVEAKIIAGIHRISDTEFEITEEARDLLWEHAAQGISRTRMIPSRRNGQVVGIKLFGVRATDVMSKLGFKNGDTVLQIAKQPITTPDQALSIYSSLQGQRIVQVQIERQGATMDITYRVVSPVPKIPTAIPRPAIPLPGSDPLETRR